MAAAASSASGGGYAAAAASAPAVSAAAAMVYRVPDVPVARADWHSGVQDAVPSLKKVEPSEDRREAASSSTAAAVPTDTAIGALEELQEYHASACRERVAFRQERSELSARLANSEHELWAEDQIAQDLARRIETLEAAIRRERLQYEGFLKADSSGSSAAPEDQAAAGAATTPSAPALAEPLPAQQEVAWQIIAAYMERFPEDRESSCRPLLLERLKRAGLSLGAKPLPTETEGVGGGSPGVFRHIDAGSHSRVAAAAWPRQACTDRRWTFRSHLDGARCIVCDESASVLVSCGEDALVKGWDLGPLWRGAPNSDELEPYITLRGHTAPVLALSYRMQDRTLFSAGMDCTIRAWHLPESNAYNAYSSNSTAQRGSIRLGALAGHTDTVWGLDRHPHLPYLASASADGSIALWAVEAEALMLGAPVGMQASLRPTADEGSEAPDVPSCTTWVPTDATKVLGGYTSSRVALYDARRATQVLELFPGGNTALSQPAGGAEGAVTSLCCHQVQQLAVTGHADNCARLIDLNSGRFVSRLSEHTDAVTSVCIDPTKGNYLVTGCHDGYARTFDLRTGRCCQSLCLHQSKYDESIHCAVIFQKLLATAGADGSVVVMLQE